MTPPKPNPSAGQADDDIMGMLEDPKTDDDELEFDAIEDSGDELPAIRKAAAAGKPAPAGKPVPKPPAKPKNDDDIDSLLDKVIGSADASAKAKKPGDSLSDEDILSELDDPHSKPKQAKEFRPGYLKTAGGTGDAAARREFEKNQARIAALAAAATGKVFAAQSEKKEKTVADVYSKAAVVFVFSSSKTAESAWGKLPAELSKTMSKHIKDVNGVAQATVGMMLIPRKMLEAVRALKTAGGILRSFKAEDAQVQQWLTEHLK